MVTTSAVMKKFGPRLHNMRVKRNWSLRELAERAQLSHTVLFYMERGTREPRLSELAKLSRVLDMPITISWKSISLNGEK